MQYLSIDIETTGLDPEKMEILSVGVIMEDTNNPLPFDKIPKLHIGVLHDEMYGSPFALNLNRELIGTLSSYANSNEEKKLNISASTGMVFCTKQYIAEKIYEFLYDCKYFTIPLPDMGHVKMINGKIYPIFNLLSKKVDLLCAGKNFGTFDKKFLEKLPYWNEMFRIKQRVIDPGVLFVDTCKQRAGLKGLVSHNAVEDAWDTVNVLRFRYGS